MDRDTTAKKVIFFLLDALLLIGALLSVLTIDRGRWLISNPAFYQAPEELEELYDGSTINQERIPVSGGESSAPSGPENIRLAPFKLSTAQWQSTFLLLDVYPSYQVKGDAQAGEPGPVQFCAP